MDVEVTAMPQRTCVGCREVAARESLLRLARGADGGVRPDPAARRPGRGAWVHPRVTCVELAAKRGGLQRAFRGALQVTPAGLCADLRAALAAEIVETSRRWERAGRASGPLGRRLAVLRSAEAELGTGSAKS
jgi:uncharacterized protein